ncbi:MAG: RIP metalloprotease RseP [Gammaproteobacteria bacterium]|nr:RIP metalloprotease RseP [Gammaproteobacteria bacterium]
MSTVVWSALAFIVTLGILITVHEFGHFWVARRLGVKVLRFSVGFGKPLWTRRGKDGTEYVLAVLPLGGYVRMLDEGEGEVKHAELPRAFNRQSLATRSAIVSAGPLFNFGFAILAYWLMFLIGVAGLRPLIGEVMEHSVAQQAGLLKGDEVVEVGGKSTPTWDTALIAMTGKALDRTSIDLTVQGEDGRRHARVLDVSALSGLDRGDLLEHLGLRAMRPQVPAVVGKVVPQGPAARAGLQAGDRLLTADGQAIEDWVGWAAYVRAHAGVPIALILERNGATQHLELTPEAKPAPDGGVVGRIEAAPEPLKALPPGLRAEQRYAPGAALVKAVEQTWEMSLLTLRLLAKMVVGEASLQNISGPLSIAEYAGYSASDGIGPFLRFLALVSVSLAILNLLPVPILDGGHLMYYLIEAVKGSPVSLKAQQIGQQLGIALLLGLTVLAFYNDLTRLFG